MMYLSGWFIFTQVVITCAFVAELLGIIINFVLWISTGGTQKDGRYKKKEPVTMIQTTTIINVASGNLHFSNCLLETDLQIYSLIH